MHCLWNYIGIRGCGVTPTSGRYVNELPGVSNDTLTSFADRETITPQALFNKVQLLAWDKLITDIPEFVENKFKLMSFEPLAAGFFYVLPDVFTSTSGVFGYQLTVNQTQSKFLGVQLSGVNFHVSAPGNYRVLVINKAGVTLVDETVIAASAGIQGVQFDEITDTQGLFIGIELDGSVGVQRALVSDHYAGYYACEKCSITCDGVSLRSAKIDAVPGTVQYSGELLAIEPVFSRVCDYSNVVCSNKRGFFRVWQYLLAWQALSFYAASGNMDRYNTVLLEQIEDLISKYAQEYESSLSTIMKNIVLDENDICVDCNTPYDRVFIMP